ncbi:MAG: hypothetical protein V4474_03540 [Patescibacteria group bacterium]
MHHAYYIEGAPAQYEEYKAALKPFWAKKFERFGVDDARALITLASLKNLQETTYFLAIVSITTEAQQALLKLLEEPQEGTTFVMLLPHGMLLPTVRSRMMAYPGQLEAQKTAGAGAFLKSTGKARSDLIAKMLKDDDDTKERVRAFVDALELELHKKVKDPAARKGLEDIAIVRDYLRDRSPSLKMLLEHLAMALPN